MKTEILVPHPLVKQFLSLERDFMFPPETEEQRASRGWLLCEMSSMMYLNEGMLTSVNDKFKAVLDANEFAYVLKADAQLTLPKMKIIFE
jgi:hypothetical protein